MLGVYIHLWYAPDRHSLCLSYPSVVTTEVRSIVLFLKERYFGTEFCVRGNTTKVTTTTTTCVREIYTLAVLGAHTGKKCNSATGTRAYSLRVITLQQVPSDFFY